MGPKEIKPCDKIISFRVTKDEKRQLKTLAATAGLSLSDLLRGIVKDDLVRAQLPDQDDQEAY